MSGRNLGPTELKRLHRGWRHRTTGRLAVVLDNVMTPVNVGSITRLAAAYGVERMWLAGATPSVSHPGARRSALGTDRYVDIVDGGTAAEAMAAARAEGYQMVGVELAEGAVPLHQAPLHPDVCVVLGHEDHGLSVVSHAACDLVVYLPLIGRVGSLNVATAAGIALAEVRRQEWAAQAPSSTGQPPD